MATVNIWKLIMPLIQVGGCKSYSITFSEDLVMGSIIEKPSNPSRTLVLGLLMNCEFAACNKKCPLRKLHNDLSIEEKQEFTLGLSDEEVNNILVRHEFCYEKRLSDLNHW
jgi:hypothetical protein